MSANLTALAYLVASVLFILALRGLSSPGAARRGNMMGIAGMAIAIGTTVLDPSIVSYGGILAAIAVGGVIGTIIARRIQMTAMPELIAGFHSLVGMAAVLVASAAFLSPESFGILDASGTIFVASRIEMALGVVIGAITFSGSIVAFAKLAGLMSGDPVMFPAQHWLNLAIGVVIAVLIAMFAQTPDPQWFWIFTGLAFAIGVLLIIPIGGADMPVVISMLNSYSGWAAAGIGFTLGNSALIVTGALVGSSGAILSYIMCKAMNRSFFSVILGGFGAVATTARSKTDKPHKEGSAEDAAFLLKNAGSVIIVPGYGMAVAQAQHVLAEVSAKLKAQGVKVRYGIHPVAGRMPGHMNVLLAEANVPYEDVHELEEINPDFSNTDVAIVIGANDVTNPAAKNDPKSPIFGMPILEVDKAKTVLFIKRSMKGVGYAGIDNELFYSPNTMMLLADAKKMMQDIGKEL